MPISASVVSSKGFIEDAPWTVDTVAYLELQGKKYVALACWKM